ncbi:MAG TPA: adenylate/guanylate cyclase domain-containing protein [Candidatus Binatia bacterium]|nr:adenylate/guanylate cyclase domain-containing protein [Candidatus Binatia bacterium]
MSRKPSETAPAETRKLAAIMFTDIVGFSRQMGADEARMLRLLTAHNHIVQQAVAEYSGQVIKTVGDAFLVDFPSVVHAVQCAQAIQAQFHAHNAEKEKDEQIHVRIGIHLGDIVQRDGDVFGDGVNIASRLQALAEPDTICISDMVYRDVVKKVPLGTVVSRGRPQLKNIAERFQVYALLSAPPKGLRQALQVHRLKLRRVRPAYQVVAGLVLIAVTIVAVRYFSLLAPNTQHLTPSTQAAPEALPLPDKPSVVVLPFVNISEDPKQKYFSDGLTEDLTSDLSQISSLFVISRNSAFTYKGKAVKLPEVSRELGVRYVLEGSVRKAGDQVRITAQLVDATQDQHLWSERYDRPLTEIFALQDEIRQKIVTALKVKLTQEERERFQRAPTNNLEAYDYWLRGLESFLRAFYEVKKEANAQARQMFEKAVELDPKYAGAYAGLGWTYIEDWFYQWNPDRAQSLERAFELGQRAAALDDSLPLPHQLLSRVYLWKKQHEQSIAEAERAVALDPNDAEGYRIRGLILVFAGRPEEGIGLIEKAMRLNPHYPPVYLNDLGFAYRIVGRYEEALVPLKKVITLNPNFVLSHLSLVACYAELGRLEEAQAEAAEVLRINPNFSLEVFKQISPYKDPADLERYLNGLRKAGLK